MVKKKSNGSLLGRSPSSSKDKTGLYLVSIVAIVAVVALFLMVKGGSSEVSGETVLVVDEAGNLIGEAFKNEINNDQWDPRSFTGSKAEVLKSNKLDDDEDGEQASNEFCRGLCLWHLGNGDQNGYDQCMLTCER